MKIAFFEIEEWEKDIVEKSFLKKDNFELFISKDKLDEKNAFLVKDYDVVSVFIYFQSNK